MSVDASFDKRVNGVVRKRARMGRNGVVHRVGRDGLIRSRPRLIQRRFPFAGVVTFVTLAFVFKAVVLAQMGPGNYDEKVATLAEGTWMEQTAAVVMQRDPVTVVLSDVLRPVFSPY